MTPDMVNLYLTDREKDLLEDMGDLGYGEIFEIQSDTTVPRNSSSLTPKQHSFIRHLRFVKHFEKVTIHDGEPVAAECRSHTRHGYNCLGKIKFC